MVIHWRRTLLELQVWFCDGTDNEAENGDTCLLLKVRWEVVMREDKSNAQSDVQMIDAQVMHLSSRIGMLWSNDGAVENWCSAHVKLVTGWYSKSTRSAKISWRSWWDAYEEGGVHWCDAESETLLMEPSKMRCMTLMRTKRRCQDVGVIRGWRMVEIAMRC